MGGISSRIVDYITLKQLEWDSDERRMQLALLLLAREHGDASPRVLEASAAVLEQLVCQPGKEDEWLASISRSRAIELLVKLMASPDPGCQQQAAKSMFELVSRATTVEVWVQIEAGGLIEPLIKLLSSSHVSVSQSAASLLASLTHCSSCDNIFRLEIANSNAIEPLVKMLDVEVCREAAAAALTGLMRCSSIVQQVVCAGAVARLVDLLLATRMRPWIPALDALYVIGAVPDGTVKTSVMKEISCAGGLQVLVAQLCCTREASDSDQGAMVLAAQIIWSLLITCRDAQLEIARTLMTEILKCLHTGLAVPGQGVVHLLLLLLESQSEHCQLMAATSCLALACFPEDMHRRALIHSELGAKIVHQLRVLCTSLHPGCRERAREALGAWNRHGLAAVAPRRQVELSVTNGNSRA